MNIECIGNLVKIEIKEACTLQEYSDKLDCLLKSNTYNIDNATIDIIDKLPIRLLITNSANIISKQTVYIIINRNPIYIISVNSEAIYLSERKREEDEIKENTIKLLLPYKVYKINQYIHDTNGSTKSFKFFNSLILSSQIFSMSRKMAIFIAKSVLQNLSQIECIKDVINLEDISSYINIIEK